LADFVAEEEILDNLGEIVFDYDDFKVNGLCKCGLRVLRLRHV
jgi:hypothetical protein